MNKINIGLFVDTFYPMIDGVVIVIDNYAKRLCKYANVYVFAPSSPGEVYDDTKFEYNVIRCKSLGLFFIDYSLPMPDLDTKFKSELRGIKLDIIHVHSPFTVGRMGVNYAIKHNIPLVATFHSQYRQDFYRATKSNYMANQLTKNIIKMFNKCDECWTMNKAIADIFYKEYGYKTKPKLINNATDMKPIKDKEKSNKKLDEIYNIQKDEKVLIFVGRINKLKNIELIIEALRHIKNIKYKMLFIGTGQDERFLNLQIDKYKLNDKVITCGRILNRELLAEYYARADLQLFPSMYDSNSLVQIEAASQKTPTLFVENSATSYNIKDNINGYIEENNSIKYAKKIEEILSDEKKLKEVSEKAYEDLYITWDDEVERIYKEYLRLIESRKV